MSDILADDGAQPLRITKEVRMRKDTLEYDYHAKRTLAWRVIERLMRTGAEPIQLAAALVIIKRTDPEPVRETTIQAMFNGPVVMRWDLNNPELSPPGSPTARKNTSSIALPDSTSSSVTADGERPPSA